MTLAAVSKKLSCKLPGFADTGSRGQGLGLPRMRPYFGQPLGVGKGEEVVEAITLELDEAGSLWHIHQ